MSEEKGGVVNKIQQKQEFKIPNIFFLLLLMIFLMILK